MALISSIDGPGRRIYLSIDSVGVLVKPMDIYKEMRTLRRTDESLRKYDLFLRAFGNVPKGGGKFTERYVVCENGTLIVPYDASHVLSIIGTIITDAGQEGVDCFDRAPLSPATVVDINYVPPQVEVITINAGSALTVEQATQLSELHQIEGLDINNPLTVTPTSRVAGGISQTLSGDGINTKTAQRD